MLIYSHGRFDQRSVTTLSRLFGVSSIGVVYAALASLGTYSFYAFGDSKKPVASSIATSTLGGVALQAVLVGPFGAGGLVAALVMANAANLCLDYWLLKRYHRKSILGARDAVPLLALLAGCLLSGTRDWSPWYLLAPPLYYYLVSYRIYGLDPKRLLSIMRSRGAVSETMKL
jgi:peptidoglycan biosynthesis protein MviN/MurJ (putative lipid II flippase)